MAMDKKEKPNKKKLGSKWRKRPNIIGTGSKEKGHGFAQSRKRRALREYKKLLKKTRNEQHLASSMCIYEVTDELKTESEEGQPTSTKETTAGVDAKPPKQGEQQKPINNRELFPKQNQNTFSEETRTRNGSKKKRKATTRFTTAQSEFKKQKFDKEQWKKEREEDKQKKIEELQRSMRKRRETYQQLNKKTRRGQPVMANQINHLLQKIQGCS